MTLFKVSDQEDCPFYSLDYQHGSQLPHCGYNHLVKRRVDRKDKGTKTCDCFGLESIQCPFHPSRYEEIKVRAKIKGCVHLTDGQCGLELANGDMHEPLCGAAISGDWGRCEASEYDE